MYFILSVYFVQCFVCLPLAIFSRATGGKYGSRKLIKSMVDRLFFDELITITLEGFLELCISGYLEHINPWRNSTEIMSVYAGYICLFLAIILLPSVLIWVLI
jgi:hypothetical protein